MYVYRHEGPLASADKDPPSDFVTDILNLITEEKSLMEHAQEVFQESSRAFWDVACMAIHPELFEYSAENDGRGVRKTTPTTISSFTRTPAVRGSCSTCGSGFLLSERLAWQALKCEASDPEEVFDSNGKSAGDSECAEDPLSQTLLTRRRNDGTFW
jgi:hypothetical protein